MREYLEGPEPLRAAWQASSGVPVARAGSGAAAAPSAATGLAGPWSTVIVFLVISVVLVALADFMPTAVKWVLILILSGVILDRAVSIGDFLGGAQALLSGGSSSSSNSASSPAPASGVTAA